MDELAAALDALAGDDLPALLGPQLNQRLRLLLTAQNRLAAEVARTLRQGEQASAAEHDGLKTMQSWLRGHGHLSAAEAARLVATGRALEQLPAVAAAFAAGALTAGQAAVIAPVADPGNLARAADVGVDVAEVDAALAVVAARQPYQKLSEVVCGYLDRLDPDGPEPDPTEGRRLTLVRHADGSRTIRGDLDAAGGEKLEVALEAIVQAGRCAGDARTRAQQLGDALVQLADNALASGGLPMLRTVKPHVAVMLDLDDLADPAPGHGAATMGSGVVISAARARWLACDSTVTRVVMGPDGQPIDHGRTKRLVPAPVRRLLDIRDGGCVFTGCDAPTWWCDAHHLLEWINGGETSPDNLALLCERHHTKVHHGFRVERRPDGRWRTWRPDGTEIRIGAALRPAA
ncbi:HNH endonuclease signature motif containing protein [Geodermatophilus maliterrae]|uniref:DUF222 domain-containing protein n=1 Tax=Geodermatophilus maliterrae TaxID=3162531 RepID=A0ABV3XJB0_9ACTN